MAAITQSRDTTSFTDQALPAMYSYPVAASATMYPGGLVALNASGFAVMAADLIDDGIIVGVLVDPTFLDTDNNTAGANGAFNVNVRQGVLDFASGTGADAITAANVGQEAFVIDDQTVGLTQGTAPGTRNKAGRIVGIDPVTGQVQVLVGFMNGPKAGIDVAMIATASLALGTGVIPDTSNAGQVVAAGLGVPVLGFVQNAPAAGGLAIVRMFGIGVVLTNGNQAIGDLLEVNASGKTKVLVPLTTTTGSNPQPCIGGALAGICLQAATGSQVVQALIVAASGSYATTAA
jgi:hypothetical protein